MFDPKFMVKNGVNLYHETIELVNAITNKITRVGQHNIFKNLAMDDDGSVIRVTFEGNRVKHTSTAINYCYKKCRACHMVNAIPDKQNLAAKILENPRHLA